VDRNVGILAYGSLMGDPGKEIKAATIETIEGVRTPFNVEFARSSIGRGGAPTLVPVKSGLPVSAQVLVLNVCESEAADRLWRREVGKVASGQHYTAPKIIGPNSVIVQRLGNFAGVGIVLYTEIAANIEPLNAERLACLAVESVSKAKAGRDGISYLVAAKRYGITTALSPDYEVEILRIIGCDSLEAALGIGACM
jgi:hypothetical protein